MSIVLTPEQELNIKKWASIGEAGKALAHSCILNDIQPEDLQGIVAASAHRYLKSYNALNNDEQELYKSNI